MEAYIVQWQVKHPDKPSKPHWVKFTGYKWGSYGLTCSGRVTNGVWYDTIVWMLYELGMRGVPIYEAWHKRPRERVESQRQAVDIDVTFVPAKILEAAEAYYQAHTAQDHVDMDGVRNAVSITYAEVRKLIEAEGFVYNEKLRDYQHEQDRTEVRVFEG